MVLNDLYITVYIKINVHIGKILHCCYLGHGTSRGNGHDLVKVRLPDQRQAACLELMISVLGVCVVTVYMCLLVCTNRVNVNRVGTTLCVLTYIVFMQYIW